jgi:histidyl-tRNA synthetase
MQKPSIPSGTRDFTPDQLLKRKYIFNTIESVYRKYGFQPIETPAMENLSTLMGKYGEEGDQLLFKILNSGDYLQKADAEKLHAKDSKKLTTEISEKGLRYDLTVPFARYVVMHRNDITFPFRRYQLQPVWRADRPQRGRYREFWQCDADVIGSDALINEVELIQIIDDVFFQLGLPVIVKINNRKILSAIAGMIGEQERLTDITVAMDKLDKTGIEKVNAELKERGVSEEAVNKLQQVFTLSGDTAERLGKLRQMLSANESGAKGIEEVEYVISTLGKLGLQSAKLELDVSLARGLNYYTGAILEVKASEGSLTGSICGGGRYDNLTGSFGLPDVSGVGISFGADRIYDVLEELNKFPAELTVSTQVLFCCMSDEAINYALPLVKELRQQEISTEIYPSAAKLKKQLSYADARKITYAVIIGDDEISRNEAVLKNLQNGEQQSLKIAGLASVIISSSNAQVPKTGTRH